MCGFSAIVGRIGPEDASSAMQAMLDAQAHRGPDDEGMHVQTTAEGAVALGARRLAIIDVSAAGHQPMVNPDTGDVLAYNGEIYNAPEIAKELKARGVTFVGHSDTEVLLRAYEVWGKDCLDRLRGMFAFGIWDARAHRLLIARDHVGIKPLYYSFTPQGFACASEIRALTASGLVAADLDRRALAGYLAYGAVQEPLTILEAVRALPAGSWMEIDPDGTRLEAKRYWSLPAVDPTIAASSALIERGRELLEASVKRHLLSDVPLGVFLSSGLDSTTVAGMAARASDADVHAFTVSIPEDESLNEMPIAERAASRLGLVFHDIPVGPSTAMEWALGGLASMDQPSMDGLNTYIVSRAVRNAGLTVALSGQGGDEVFGGYRSFRAIPRLVPLARVARPIPGPLRRVLAQTAARPWGRGASKRAGDLASTTPEAASFLLLFRRLLSDEEIASLGYRSGDLDLSRHFLDASVTPDGGNAVDDVAIVGRLETQFYLGNTLLRDGDVFGMANSLEIRVPMLDRDVMDWAFKLPGRVLAPRGAAPKTLLRQIAGDLLSDEQLAAPKRGFGLPLARWMKGPLSDLRRESLATLADSGLLDRQGMAVLEERYLKDKYRSAWTRVWAMVTLGQWIGSRRTVNVR